MFPSTAGWVLLKLLFVFLLILGNGFFVASEFALVSVRRVRISALAKQGHGGAKAALRLLDDPRVFISVTQFGVTLASLGLGWVGEATLADDVFVPLFHYLLPNSIAAHISAHAIAVVVAFALVTFLVIVLGEITPKTVSLEKTTSVALFVSRPLELFYKTFRPFINLLNVSSTMFLRLLGMKAAFPHSMIYSQEELRHIISMSYKSGILNEQEREVIHNVFDFTDKVVREVMIPRSEVAAIDSTLTLKQAQSEFIRTGYSRMPVYEGQRENIIGVVHSKDLMSFNQSPATFNLARIARKPLFIPDTASLGEALRQIKTSKAHFGIVVDEHGGFEGIITLEDLLEEIVGEIHDEYDEASEEALFQYEDDGSIIASGSLSVRDANKFLRLNIPESDDYTTLAGFLLDQSGKMLSRGELVEFAGLKFTIEEAQRHKIVLVRIVKPADVPAATTSVTSD